METVLSVALTALVLLFGGAFALVWRELSRLRTDIGELRTETAQVRTEMAQLRTEMAQVRTDVHDLMRQHVETYHANA